MPGRAQEGDSRDDARIIQRSFQSCEKSPVISMYCVPRDNQVTALETLV